MGIEALYRRPRTTKPEPGHIPDGERLRWTGSAAACCRRAFSVMMETAACAATPEDALTPHGKPEIFNTDQGSQFTARRDQHGIR